MAEQTAVMDGTSISGSMTTETPQTSRDLVVERFIITQAKADEMMDLLVGTNGEGGFLGEMNSVITSAPVSTITAPAITTNIVTRPFTGVLPVFDPGELAAYPVDTYTEPALDAVPSIDMSVLEALTPPTPVTPTLDWTEAAYNSDIYADILARILADIQDGATGLDPLVEQAIYDRARVRQQVERDAKYQQLNNNMLGRNFQFPSGALASALTDFYAESNRMDADINNTILIAQGELAQKNSQFIIDQAMRLEALLRSAHKEGSDRLLEKEKQDATILVQIYSENVKAYVSELEGQKANIMAQVEAMKGVIEANKGKVEVFKELYASLGTRIAAVTSQNKGITEVFVAEMQGYGEEARATAAINNAMLEEMRAEIQAAELQLRAMIANADAAIRSYTAEMSLREKVADDMARIASQSMAAWGSSVNASASIGYNASVGQSKSFGLSANLTESHSYEHDPVS